MTFKEQVIESVEEQINEMNKNLESKLNQTVNKKVSDSVSEMTNNNKVSGNYSNESNIEVKSDSSDIIKNVVLESKVNNGEEVLEKVESSDGRVCEERLGGQRADFRRVYGETEFSQMFYEDIVSSRGYRDEVSLSRSPFVYHEVLGRAKMCHDNIVLPFAWSDRDKMKCCYDEKYFERERE